MLLSALFALPLALRTALAYTALSNTSLSALTLQSTDFSITTPSGLLAPILIPRVPGTPGSDLVLNHFVNFFRSQLPDWELAFQNSSSITPTSGGKEVPFRNLVLTRDPPWIEGEGDVGRLALVAHYDSKLTPHNFIGATDSAAPCAMLMHTARAIDTALTAKWSSMEADGSAHDGLSDHKGIQILLLDGEEAFEQWTHTDSIYGARALAEEWETTMNPAMSTFRNQLESIDLFVLLDLLGSSEPRVPSYFKTTHWAYQHLSSVEARLRSLNILQTKPAQPFLFEGSKKETDSWVGGMIEDDHIPFMARGVEILHVIPSTFPRVWHTMQDDGEHLDLPTVEDWAMITTAFAAEWMELEGFMGAESAGKGEGEGEIGQRDEL
jgi:glutaminyl-peptide cyclotransferase